MRIFIYLFLLLCFKLSFTWAWQDINLSDFSEEVYVHKSKNIAVAGETIPFSVDIRLKDKPTPSKMAYAELISRKGERLSGTIIPLNSGKASAYLNIPTSIPSDNYLFRVYTRLAGSMADESHYHHGLITIINPNLPPQVHSAFTGPWQESHSKNDLQMSLNKVTLAKEEKGKITIAGLEGQNLTISISKKNPYLPVLQAEIPTTEFSPASSLELFPELRGHIIKGSLSNDQVDSTQVYFLSAHGTQSELYLAKPNDQGQVYFELGPLKDYDFLLLQTAQDSVPFSMSIQQPFAPINNKDLLKFPLLELTEKDREFLNDLILSYSTTDYYFQAEARKPKEIQIGFEADVAYNLDEYNRFDDLATTLKEYIPTVMVRKNRGKYHFKLSNYPESRMFQENPLMLIDAMPVFDSDALGLHSADGIERIEVINRKYYILDNIFEGLINIKSFNNDFGGFPIPERALYLEYPIIQKALDWRFNAPLSEGEGQLPDYRTILYWEENVELVNDGRVEIDFITSQIAGDYEVKVSTISPDGTQNWSKLEFTVLPD